MKKIIRNALCACLIPLCTTGTANAALINIQASFDATDFFDFTGFGEIPQFNSISGVFQLVYDDSLRHTGTSNAATHYTATVASANITLGSFVFNSSNLLGEVLIDTSDKLSGFSVGGALNGLSGINGGTDDLFLSFPVDSNSQLVLISMTGNNSVFQANTTESQFTVPVPAAAWLFGSGLISLMGLARRQK